MLRGIIALGTGVFVAGLVGVLVLANRRAVPPPGTAGYGLSAVQVANRLRAQGLPIEQIRSLPAPARQSRVSFADGRISHRRGAVDTPVSRGGVIEVLADSGAASERLYGLQAGQGLPGEHDYVFGVIVLRITPRLSRAQAAVYQADLYRVAAFKG